ncbi:hypothetical protein SAMN06265373_108121 [Shimia sagamensis]|uniref:Uncharacterized protein n=1 Tax=Shimia sagamensis TaxID=1566352 RepID=A0ABY1PF33_9RHOB|nr:hypothetical protein SAMN06265373_108121 [Shimia sagamensis]
MANDDNVWLGPVEQLETETEELAASLLARVEFLCVKRGWSEGYFSKLAAGDVNVVRRLRDAGRVTAAKMAQIERYLEAEGVPTSSAAEPAE